MNTLDIVILLVLAAGLVHGFSKGLVRQVFSIVGVVVAFILSVQFMEPVGQLAAASLGLSQQIAPLAGFVVVFLGIQVLAFVFSRMAESMLETLHLTGINRLLGGAVGAVKAGLLMSVLFLLLAYVGFPSQNMKENSRLYQPVSTSIPQSWDFVSEYVPRMEILSEHFKLSESDSSEPDSTLTEGD